MINEKPQVPPVTNPSTLQCADGAGALNDPTLIAAAQLANSGLAPYVAPTITTGTWSLTGLNPDLCAQNEILNQQTYAAEVLNISGAPINVFRLLGVHEQGSSVFSSTNIITSTSYPGFPGSTVNSLGWRSLAQGTNVTTSGVFIGLDFGIKFMPDGTTPFYEPSETKWTDVGSISLTQSNLPNQWAQQVRIDITDGNTTVAAPFLAGTGNGNLEVLSTGLNCTQAVLTAVATNSTTFNCYITYPNGNTLQLGTASVGVQFNSLFCSFIISTGSVPFATSDMFTVAFSYIWKRAAVFTLLQSPSPQVLNLQSTLKVKAFRVVPIMFTGTDSWVVTGLDVSSAPSTDINNIQDLFLNENRDRDYQTTPISLQCHYNPADSVTDLGKLGLSILDQWSFQTSYASMVSLLGRPIITGDLIEVTPELQWDQNLKPIRKFLEVTDTGWAASGYGPSFKPFIYRFNAQPAIASQETRDIFGTLDTQKYLVPDRVLLDGLGLELNTTPLSITEEIVKTSLDLLPQTGSNDERTVGGIPLPLAVTPNDNGNPPPLDPSIITNPTRYVESALPPNNAPYTEGYQLPDISTVIDGQYFRLFYPSNMNIPVRLYRYSALKNRWLYLESDRRSESSSFKPSLKSILSSSTSTSISGTLT